MPKGVKGFQKGHPSFMTEKAKEKASQRMKGNKFRLGKTPWNKGTKGVMKAWNKDKKMEKSPWNRGKKMGFIPKRAFKKGNIPWNKGLKRIHLSPETEFKKGDKRISGKNNCNWKDGKAISPDGYTFICKPSHPKSNNGYIAEHRFVIEQMIGRFLKPKEVVHHINEIKSDNRPENLICFPNQSAHQRFHHNPNNVKSSEIIFDGRKLSD